MTKSSFRLGFYAVMTLLVMGLIFYLSSQDADMSQNLSDGLLFRLLSVFGLEQEMTEVLCIAIRKIAHFAEYAALGLFSALFFYELERMGASLCPAPGQCALALSLVYAASDELHQHFVPGRSMQLGDVALDFSGALMAVLFLRLFRKIINHTRGAEEL